MKEQALIIPISTSSGEYYIKLRTVVPEQIVCVENITQFDSCIIYEVLLHCERRCVQVDMEAMNKIGSNLLQILDVNPNIILYVFCDFDANTIRINKNNKDISPQEYRSRLFSNLFDRTTRRGNRHNFQNKVHVISDGNDDYYLHLIYPEHLAAQAQLLKKSVDDMPK